VGRAPSVSGSGGFQEGPPPWGTGHVTLTLHSSWSMSSWRRLTWSRHRISAPELCPVSEAEEPGDQVGDRPMLRRALRPARRLPWGLLCTPTLSSSDRGPRAWASRVSDAPSNELCRAWSWLTVSRRRKRVTNWSTLEARSYSWGQRGHGQHFLVSSTYF